MKENLRNKTDEELEEILAKIPKPHIAKKLEEMLDKPDIIKKLEESKFKGKLSLRPDLEKLSRIETYDNVASFIYEATAKALLEEDKLLLVYGTCYTAILHIKDDDKGIIGMEFVVSFKDPREHPDYKDRIMTLRRSTVKQGNRLEEEILK